MNNITNDTIVFHREAEDDLRAAEVMLEEIERIITRAEYASGVEVEVGGHIEDAQAAVGIALDEVRLNIARWTQGEDNDN